MALDIVKETYHGYGKKLMVSVQTAVECKFPDVGSVLLCHANTTLLTVEADNGEIRYTGKVRFFVVYENEEGKVCRAEKGVEFTARTSDENVLSTYTPKLLLSVETVSVHREGTGVTVTALVGGDTLLFGDDQAEIVTGGALVSRRETVTLHTTELISGDTEAEDEFETECVGDILLHSESVVVTECKTEAGAVKVTGEVNLGILALKGETGVTSFERLIPFSAELPVDKVVGGESAEITAICKEATVHAESDEDRGTCLITARISLGLFGTVAVERETEIWTDAYSTACKVRCEFVEIEGTGSVQTTFRTERVSAKAVLSAPVSFSDTLQAVTLQSAEAEFVVGEDGGKIEGVAQSTLVVLGSDGAHRGIPMSIPFSIPETSGMGRVEVLALGTSARQRQEGEIEAEVVLHLAVKRTGKECVRVITEVVEGEKIERSDCAVSVYLPVEGEDLWAVAKRLAVPPEEVAVANPDLTFPVPKGARIVVYRQKTL